MSSSKNKKKYPKELITPIVAATNCSSEQEALDKEYSQREAKLDLLREYLQFEDTKEGYRQLAMALAIDRLSGFKIVCPKLNLKEQSLQNDIDFFVAVLRELRATKGNNVAAACKKVVKDNPEFLKFKHPQSAHNGTAGKKEDSARTRFIKLKGGKGSPLFNEYRRGLERLSSSGSFENELLALYDLNGW